MKRLSITFSLAFVLAFVPTCSNGFGQPPPRATGYKPLSPEKRAAIRVADVEKHGGRIAMAARNLSFPVSYVEVSALPIGDQGNCGSCYLYSTVQTASSAFCKAGYGKPDGSFWLSTQFGMDCHNFGGCNGGNGTEVIDWMCSNGWPAESYVNEAGATIRDYPAYEARSRTCRKVPGAKVWKPATWGLVSSSGTPTVNEIKAAIVQYGCLNIAIDAGGQFGSGTGTITSLGRSIDHEIQCVGWDDNKDGGSWLLQNQWSSDWGNNGRRYCTYAAGKNIVDWFWVSVSPLPPPPPIPPPVPPGPGPIPTGTTITLSSDLKAGTYQIAPSGSLVLDPKMTLEELLNSKRFEPVPVKTKEPTVPPMLPAEQPKRKAEVPCNHPERMYQTSTGNLYFSDELLPDGAERYEPTKWTQAIDVIDGRRRIDQVPIADIDSKWHQSGGMEGIDKKLWTSEKYRVRPAGSKTWIDDIVVKNGKTYRDSDGTVKEATQKEKGIVQEFVNGTRFDDVLKNSDGVVFEHRMRAKADGKWASKVLYANEDARPAGYTGLKVTCASCHNQAGTGGYGVGLVPGGDTVLSESLDWSQRRKLK